jgi:hypothetical protein
MGKVPQPIRPVVDPSQRQPFPPGCPTQGRQHDHYRSTYPRTLPVVVP